ncbi:hypothetical protein EHQ68_04625 [Leptospira congkakensis]|uniref:Uncharacterized protein n=1 Tax=Leptospira congkakensis TaxID=2484932 RepID=A0A4Z1ADQ5_9LEPT|nr:hypothetical protein [Leptospira congkakensis]TGL90713.1 hypothetical protein EHQ69_12385 [Leptospira congkakensis]TGL91720.1 hypothetical protein EHQ68_04625 [Leptospira congkakensis]TGL98773.1 hypothetical protein EHQ70_04210 [Leptospira congkakensis]
MKKNAILLTVLTFSLMLQTECKKEYVNSAPLCAIALAELHQNLAKDMQELNEGKITQAEYNAGVKLRENGAYTLCLASFVDREENKNF